MLSWPHLPHNVPALRYAVEMSVRGHIFQHHHPPQRKSDVPAAGPAQPASSDLPLEDPFDSASGQLLLREPLLAAQVAQDLSQSEWLDLASRRSRVRSHVSLRKAADR